MLSLTYLAIIFVNFKKKMALSLSSAASHDASLGAGPKLLEIVDDMTLLNMELFKLESSK